MHREGRLTVRLIAILAVGVLAVIGGGCGSDEDSGPSAATGSERQTSAGGGGEPATAKPATEEAAIEAVYGQLVDALYEGDGKRACGLLTTKIRKKYAEADLSCEEHMASVGRDRFANERPSIYRLRVDGDRAMARAGLERTKKYPVPFEKENGEWRVAATR